jgi:hypothetical protein
MSEPETRLRHLLEVAAGDPPRSVSVSEVRRRARRRKTVHGMGALSAAATVSAVAVIAAVIPGAPGTGATGALGGPTAYVATSAKTVVAINLKTHSVVKTITVKAGGTPLDMAVTPNGETVYVLSAPVPTPAAPVPGRGAVTPISTATDRAGRPIRLRGDLLQILITPNGQTAYVVAAGTGLLPIDLSTGQPLREIKVRGAGSEAMMPNGKTIYVNGSDGIVPVDLAAGKALRPITVPRSVKLGYGPVISPNGSMLYDNADVPVASSHPRGPFRPALLPVNLTTRTALTPITVKNFGGLQLAFGAGGTTVYWAGNNSAVPVETATNKPLKQIRLPSSSDSYIIGSSPDGRTVYATNQSAMFSKAWVVPINTATNTAGAPVNLDLPGWASWIIAAAPDGSVYVGSMGREPMSGMVTVIRSGSSTAGKHIRIHGTPEKIVFAP